MEEARPGVCHNNNNTPTTGTQHTGNEIRIRATLTTVLTAAHSAARGTPSLSGTTTTRVP